ncbi:MAG TPA: hypothetical protein VKU87_01885, partial [Thermomicrobiaceae bacterium]|nr:hypothetical protein [Thermomicrobiaceae bacterium]
KVYAGTYSQPRGSVSVRVEDGGLVATMRSNASLEDQEDGDENKEESKIEEYPPMTMKPIGHDAFLVVGGDADGMTIEFIPGEGEQPRFVRFGGRLLDREK